MPTTDAMSNVLTELQTIERWPAGRVLFREGEEPKGIYFLLSGQIDLIFSARNGYAKPLRVAEEGHILGLSAIVSQRKHDYSATTRTPCEIGFVDCKQFLDFVDHRPAVWFNVLQLLSEDFQAGQRIGSLRVENPFA